MNKSIRFFFSVTALFFLISCGHNNRGSKSKMDELSFPYQEYLDSISEDEIFPTIGNDGNGFNAISHNIVYPELSDSLSLSNYADSLLQFYNIILAYNTMAYDVGTAERYMETSDFVLDQANALDSINLSGINILELRNLLKIISHKGAEAIRSGKRPNDQQVSEVAQFYNEFNNFSDPLYDTHLNEKEFNPVDILPNYEEIHTKALTDTTSFRDELLEMVLSETDFQKQCVLARELAYANYHSPNRDDKEIVTVLDNLLRTGRYSPLLGELWRMWRSMLQIGILGSGSNDGAMYNLFYNQMKNRIALLYIAHMKTHDHDNLAFKEFVRMAMTHNIVRNSPCYIGNNAYLEEMELFYSVFNPDNNENN